MDNFTKISISSFMFMILLQHSTSNDHLVTLSTPEFKHCREFPKVRRVKLLECCSLPDFFKSEIKEKCVSECTTTDIKHDPWCCMAKCMMEESELGSNGTVHKVLAKKYFRKLFNSTDIKKLVDVSVTKCENEAPDSQTELCTHPEYGSLLSCVHKEMFRTCIMGKADSNCMAIKNFVKKCPGKKDEFFEM